MDPSSILLQELLRHEDFARDLALCLTGDSHAAEDLVQQTWLRALLYPPSHRRALRGWLQTVLRNLARTRFKADRKDRDNLLALSRQMDKG
jgi:DNA-directed RNA polymerase specialized sigma24 family protein